MIERVERKQTNSVLVIDKIDCDMCGKDARVKRGIGSDDVPAARFERLERNTEENQLDPYAFINEWVWSEIADLCDSCAQEVSDTIRRIAEGKRGKHPGIRRPQKVDETIRRGVRF